MSKRSRSSKDQTITVAEFKQWLSGVEDMQPSGWVPNDEQWKKIRSKIAALSDEVAYEDVPPQQFHQPAPVYHQPQYQPMPQQRVPQVSLGDELFIPKPGADDMAFDQSMNLSTPGVTQFG